MPGFPERLKLLRQNYGLSQQKLADEIGTISKSSINMYERGDREPSMETMEALADFFNVDLAYLFGRSDIPNSAMCPPEASPPQLRLTPHERDLVIAYRKLPSEVKKHVDMMLGIASDPASIPQPKQA